MCLGRNCFQGTTPCAQLANSVPYKFTSRRLDPETELYYYRARMYWGTGGRFLQTDPVGYTADLNLYTYVGNDPVDRTDAWGMKPGDQFDTTEEVAYDALMFYNQRSIDENIEFAGPILRGSNGKFFSAPPVTGHGDNFTWKYTGTPSSIWGDWHAHGDYSVEGPNGLPRRTHDPHRDSYKSDKFSTKDKLNSKQRARESGNPHYKSFLGTPGEGFKQYDPKTGEETPLPAPPIKQDVGTPPSATQSTQGPEQVGVCSTEKGGCGPSGGAGEVWGGGSHRW